MKIVHGCAREEREEGATQEEIITKLKLQKTAKLSGLYALDYPVYTRVSGLHQPEYPPKPQTTSHAPSVTTLCEESENYWILAGVFGAPGQSGLSTSDSPASTDSPAGFRRTIRPDSNESESDVSV